MKTTVYVLGAGSSKEAGLPTGAELKIEIAGALALERQSGTVRNGDPLIYEALRMAFKQPAPPTSNFQELFAAARRISGAMPLAMSIDNFIDAHQGDRCVELCGKLAIVRTILASERKCSLFFDRTSGAIGPDFRKLEPTWFTALFQSLVENCRKADLPARLRRASFIVFNYDRCLELFLLHALANYYNLSIDDAAELLANVTVLHPYGTVGNLDELTHGAAAPFGAESSAESLLLRAAGIKTFTEGTDPDSSEIRQIRELVSAAQRVVFLGFAFHPLNMDLLCPRPAAPGALHKRTKDIYATAFRMSDSDTELVKGDLAYRLNADRDYVRIRSDRTCSELMRDYSRSLSYT